MLKKIIKYLVISCLILNTVILNAQDIQFSQFYAVPLYQNPAFAGSAHTTRAMLHQRLQWIGLNGINPDLKGSKYITSLFSVDHYIPEYKSGVGLMVFRDWQGGATLNSTNVALQYSYDIHLNSNWTFKPGIGASWVSRTVDYSALRFPTQYDDSNLYKSSVASPLAGFGNKVNYADFSSGGILYNDKVWFGFAADHLSRPNQSFLDGMSRLPIKYSLTGGYKFILRKEKSSAYLEAQKQVSLTPTFHYKLQGKSDQLDVGLYLLYGELMAGAWYRGLPVKRYENKIQNNESLILLVGWKMKDFSVSYSYDLTVSRLAVARTGGAHEINLTYYRHKHKRPRKPMKRLPCPQFYKH